MNDFLAKPVNRTKLVSVLATWAKADRATPQAGAGAVATLPIATSEELFDAEQIRAMRDDLGEEMLEAVIESFWSDAETLMAAIASAVASGDTERLRLSLHSLKGTAQTVGYVAIARAAAGARTTMAADGRIDLGPLQAAVIRTRAASGRRTAGEVSLPTAAVA